MTALLENIIKHINELNNYQLSRLEIKIDCPLDSGVTVTAVGIREDRKIEPQLGGVKDFFHFVQEYRSEHPTERFNRIVLIAENGIINKVSFSFDDELHKETMDNVR